ncbi:MAG TPA: hypothetical protein VK797_28030 [Tepidisphaeraceae bacterium]|jgi:hypothetical protein|nr:hypothetical protein [Tepidisphaeraceae bacterium]
MASKKLPLDYATPTSPQRRANSLVNLAKFITAILMMSAMIAGAVGNATGVRQLVLGAGMCLALAILLAVLTIAVGFVTCKW